MTAHAVNAIKSVRSANPCEPDEVCSLRLFFKPTRREGTEVHQSRPASRTNSVTSHRFASWFHAIPVLKSFRVSPGLCPISAIRVRARSLLNSALRMQHHCDVTADVTELAGRVLRKGTALLHVLLFKMARESIVSTPKKAYTLHSLSWGSN